MATVLRIEGAVDATNARLVAQVVRRFSRLNPPLIVDLSNLDFLGIAGFRELLDLDWERENDQPSCRIVTGAALCRLTRVFTDHDLPVVDSIPEGLHQLDEAIRARRRFISVLARKLELQRATPVVRKFATDS
ncbi:MAG: sulfate transporter [Mycobacterium sp.]|nr:sulfate transporter [Mycobacterium sp.]